MAQITPNSFTTYELNEDETKHGSMLTIQQIRVIQNAIAMHAELRLALVYDPEKPLSFLQEEAYNKGAIDALKYLVNDSNALQNLD